MKGKRYTEEKVIGTLKEYEADLSVDDIIRKHGRCQRHTFYNWKSKFSGMEMNKVKWLRDLEAENTKLMRLLAYTMPKKASLERCAVKKW